MEKIQALLNNPKNQGFTLLELLVALSIFSMISVMAYGGLQTVITTKNSTQNTAERIAEIQLAIVRMSNDLRQAVPRKIRDEQGSFLAEMQLSTTGDNSLEWSRAGYRNPARLQRSNIQRVAYILEDNKLLRLTWPVLDRAQDSEKLTSEVLTKIESISWQFYTQTRSWVNEWPSNGDQSNSNPLPDAVEITFELSDLGKFRRLILLSNKQ